MQKPWVLPCVGLVGGLAGCAARRIYLANAFETGTGLPISGLAITGVVWVIFLLTAAAAFLASKPPRHSVLEDAYTRAFAPIGGFQAVCYMAAVVLFVIGGFACLASVSQLLQQVGVASQRIIRPVMGLVSLAAAAGLYFTVLQMKKGEKIRSAWITLPGFTCCLWVMSNYQTWAQDPVLERNLFPLLATLLSLVACYLIACFAFTKGRLRLTMTVATLAAALDLTILADAIAASGTVAAAQTVDGLPQMPFELIVTVSISLGLVFYLLSMVAALVKNDAKADPPTCPGATENGSASCAGCPGCQ